MNDADSAKPKEEPKHFWPRARQYADLLNPIPFSINNPIAALWQNHLANLASGSDSISQESIDSMRLAEKSPVLTTPLLYAANSLYPEKVEPGLEQSGTKGVIKILGPGLYAVLLGFVYLHRRLNKICTTEDWQTLSKEIVLNMEVGYLVGKAIPSIGPALGTLVSGIRFVGLGALLVADPEQFHKYRNLKKHRFDIEYEDSHWGANHIVVSSFLLSDIGIRTDTPHVVSVFLDDPTLVDQATIPADLATWKTVLLLVEAAKHGIQSQDFQKLGISEPEFEALNESLAHLFSQGSSFSWMFKTTTDEAADPKKSE